MRYPPRSAPAAADLQMQEWYPHLGDAAFRMRSPSHGARARDATMPVPPGGDTGIARLRWCVAVRRRRYFAVTRAAVRRFFARPSSVLLSATGTVSP